MEKKIVWELLTAVLPKLDIKEISRTHGIVHKGEAAEINGVKGFLVWDYILYNEITFDDMDGKCYSLFTSYSDKETEEKWKELVDKYKI